jgi:uncharacterized membrane protein
MKKRIQLPKRNKLVKAITKQSPRPQAQPHTRPHLYPPVQQINKAPMNMSGNPYPAPPAIPINPYMIPPNAGNIGTMDRMLIEISNNKLFIGFVMIMLNIGGRYLSMELPKNVERLFESTWMRIFVVFCISFMGTRDIKIALIITLLFVILMKFLFHEESHCCILPDRISKESIETKKKQEEMIKSKLNSIAMSANISNSPPNLLK